MPTSKRAVANGGSNALWIQWLEEEKQKVSERYGQTITKAQRALRDHPVPVTNPNDLHGIKFFGPAIVEKIKKRQRVEHRSRNNEEDTHATAAGSPSQSGPPPNNRSHPTNIDRRVRPSMDETDDPASRPTSGLAGLYAPTILAPDPYPRVEQRPEEQPVRQPEDFLFTYCDQAQKPVSQQLAAAVQIHEQHGFLLYAILFRADNLPLAKAAGVVKIEPTRSDRFTDTPLTYHGFLPETSGLASRLQSTLLSPLPPPRNKSSSTDPLRTLPPHTSNQFTAGVKAPGPHNTTARRTASTSSIAINANANDGAALQRIHTLPSDHPVVVVEEEVPDEGNTFPVDASTSARLQRQPLSVSADFDLVEWSARSYDVICLVDTREMKDADSRDFIAVELAKRGVQVERRPLQLGDVLWIARRKPAYRDQDIRNGIANAGEVVLDFIVERKRLDDLVASIKDGRYHEQKFRLKKSGLANVFFVFERSKSRAKDLRPFEDAINTVISSTQVVDEYFVHQTEKTIDTVEFLALLHNSVRDKYWNTNIHVIPQERVHRETYNDLQRELKKRSPNYTILTFHESFDLVNAKYTFQTVKECFSRQLLCIKGMSAERASFVVEEYGTMRGLWEAFRQASIQEELMLRQETEIAAASGKKGKGKSKVPKAEFMLAELGRGRRKIGKELSKKVYHLFTDDTYNDKDEFDSDG